jgi:hypothetical protein
LTTALVAAAAITVVAVFLFAGDAVRLRADHARLGALFLDLARWLAVLALAWGAIVMAATDSSMYRTITIVGMGGLAVALMIVPAPWFVLFAGRDPSWELRSLRVEISNATNRIRRDRALVTPARIRGLIGRTRRSRTPGTAELCDLLEAELTDVTAGDEAWNEAGRRSIRIDELCRGLWGREVPQPDYDRAEATFRWRLYRIFGQLMELGTARPTPAARGEFVYLLRSLGAFRRSDTAPFISDVRRSALRWLSDGSAERAWIENLDFSVLGPNAAEGLQSIWGRDSAMWGAELDADDRLALEKDRGRRASKP